MRARKRLAALLIAGALSAPMLNPAPASAVFGGGDLSGGLLGLDLAGLLGTGGPNSVGGLTSALQGVLGGGLLNDVLRDSSLLNQCGLALGLLDPATCLTGTQIPTTTGINPFGFGGLNPFGSLGGVTPFVPQSFGGFPHIIPVPIRQDNDDPIVVTNNNASSSSSSAAAAAAPGGGASATATGNTNSNQSQTIVIP